MFTLHRTTRIAICCSAAVLAGCAKKDNAAVDTTSTTASSTTSTTTTTTAPAPINLADVAGKWDSRSVPTTGKDTSATTNVLTATSTTAGWTITLPGRKPMPAQVTVGGDSVIVSAGPFPSVRRKGVRVTTNTVFRLQNGSLAGTTTAHYQVKTPDSVLTLTTTATRSK